MSYALPGEEPAPSARRRPGTVTAATWLLLIVGVLLALGFFTTVPLVGDLQDAYREAFQGTDAEGTEDMQAFTQVAASVIRLLLGIGFVVLAIFNHRGANASRIVTWVLAGLALCCVGAGLAVSSLLTNVNVEAGNVPDPETVQRALEEHLPAWYFALELVITFVTILFLIAVII